MAVSLREKNRSLYLDIYFDGRRKYEFLDLKLSGEREHDADIWKIANKIRAEREVAILSSKYDFSPAKNKTEFYCYAEKFIASKNDGNQLIYGKFLKHFRKYAGNSRLLFTHLTPTFCQEFYSYLLQQKLKPNTINLYFIKLKTIVNSAINDGIISTNPTKRIKMKHGDSSIKFLLLTELKQLVATPCSNQIIRDAFLFGCFTGLRISDIFQLQWSHVNGNRIELIQEKTKRMVMIPLNKTALWQFYRVSQEMEIHVFNFPHHRTINRTLQKWSKDAELNKQITFHWSRHTFATLALSSGVDIYVVSKLLGHAKLSTTTVYAQLLNSHREEEMNKLPELLLP